MTGQEEREAERAEIVAWLRKDARQCDCFAREERDCSCGAWLAEPDERSFKTAYVEDIADAIESLAHKETSDEG